MRDSALSAKNTKRKCEPSSLRNKPRNWRKCDEAIKDVLGNVQAVKEKAGPVNALAAKARAKAAPAKKAAKPRSRAFSMC